MAILTSNQSMKSNAFKILTAGIIALSFFSSIASAQYFSRADKSPVETNLLIFTEVFNAIKTEYFIEVSNARLLNGCLKGLEFGSNIPQYTENDLSIKDDQGATHAISNLVHLKRADYSEGEMAQKIVNCTVEMVSSLDSSSHYISQAEMNDYAKLDAQGTGVIGVSITNNQDDFLMTTLAGSPAAIHGVPHISHLIEVDEQPVKGLQLIRIMQLLRGAPGTKVNLVIQRDGATATERFEIVRAIAKSDYSLEAKWLEPSYIYIRLKSFPSDAGKQVAEKINELSKNHTNDPKGIILDLRSNPGGNLSEAVAVSALFLPRDRLIVWSEGRASDSKLTLKDDRDNYIRNRNDPDFVDDLPTWRTTIPLAILINHDSGGDSEIVAGAIQDWERGIVLGEKSYGNGKTQIVLRIHNGGALKLTNSAYYTPNSRPIDGIGITPDILIDPTKELSPNLTGDRPLELALQTLAQQSAVDFPSSASAFLAQELPQMEVAVSKKERNYFEGGLARVQVFLNSWGLNSPISVAIDTYPVCANAVSNFLIVGLCKISPPGTICEPDTFLPKVAANIAACNKLAGSTNHSSRPASHALNSNVSPAKKQ